MAENKTGRGGKREGAGRPKNGKEQKTKPVRIPLHMLAEVLKQREEWKNKCSE